MASASVSVRLIGSPAIERDGRLVTSPRGRKAWGLLGYLLLSERPVSRRQAAELLFGEADDPLGALRWTLAELRRTLAVPGALRGDPIVVGLESVWVDVAALDGEDALVIRAMRGELLEGLSVDGCPVFESWLVVERHRVSAGIEARLRDAAAKLMAAGCHDEAVQFASQVVSRNVLDESNHELLVRCLAAAGDEAAALRQVAVCEEVLAREFGLTPSVTLRAAARYRDPSRRVTLGGRSEVLSLLDAGRAAVAGGAVEAGLDCLQRAVAKAATNAAIDTGTGDDHVLHGQALLGFGGALVHAVRGRHGEGAAALHDALRIAQAAGDDRTTAIACRELGFVDVQAGRRLTATAWLERAGVLAVDDELRASVLGVQGMNESDAGRYGRAVALLERSASLAARCGDPRQQAWSLSILARAHLLRDERTRARHALAQSIAIVQDQRWVAFLPWPQALKAELDLLNGDRVEAAEVEQAWALSCHLADPCWEAMTARALGLLSADRGDNATAAEWFDEARRRCDAMNGTYQWVKAYVIDAATQVALDAGDRDRARSLTDTLAALAARGDMGEFVVRAQLHRWRLGEPGALDAAHLLGATIDNPALHRRIQHAAEKDRP